MLTLAQWRFNASCKMTKGNVTEREFVEKQAVIGALRDEIGATRKKLFETEEALTTMHNKYEEQQKALHAAMEGWTDAANLQFSVVQELRTAEAQLVIVHVGHDSDPDVVLYLPSAQDVQLPCDPPPHASRNWPTGQPAHDEHTSGASVDWYVPAAHIQY